MLRITKQTDYGIILMTQFVAPGANSVLAAPDLAHRVGLPLPMVSKILKALARSNLLLSHRGVKGGYSLARSASEISVAEVVEALEGPIAITECLDEGPSDCGIESLCPVRTNWERINRAVQDALTSIPLSEMAKTVSFSDLIARRKAQAKAIS